MARVMAAHARAIEAMELRRAESLAAHQRVMEAIRQALGGQAAADGGRKPPGAGKRRGKEGGEPVPAVPKPKPKPLAGAAAAPIE